MTPEEKRDQLLKRVLPALGICVIYFVFISGFIKEKVEKAEKEYTELRRKGVSTASLPALKTQLSRAREEKARLQKKVDGYRQQLKGMAGFLSGGPNNQSAALLSEILARNGILVLEEKREHFPVAQLPRSVRELRKWLQTSKKKAPDSIDVQHLWLLGRYPDMYQATLEMAKRKFPAIPVKLSMIYADEEVRRADDDQKWELVLWM